MCKTYTHPCWFISCLLVVLCVFLSFVFARTLIRLRNLLLLFLSTIVHHSRLMLHEPCMRSPLIRARINLTKARTHFPFSKFQFGAGIKNSIHNHAVKSIKKLFFIDKGLLFHTFFPPHFLQLKQQNKHFIPFLPRISRKFGMLLQMS